MDKDQIAQVMRELSLSHRALHDARKAVSEYQQDADMANETLAGAKMRLEEVEAHVEAHLRRVIEEGWTPDAS